MEDIKELEAAAAGPEEDNAGRPEDAPAEETAAQAGLEEKEGEVPEPDPKEVELNEARDRILRLHADFDNYRKRVQREKEEWFQYASLHIIEKLLPVVDNLERALENLNSQTEEVRNLFSGVVMTYRQMMEILEREGLEAIDAAGQPFDPLLHEAIMQVPAEEGQEDNKVTEVLRKGYRFKDKVVRPAMVKVAKR
ncbi:MAG: nucleotide exchange factor GrpE [Peptococcaceae bacterium]|jgi:molecular chaperone GrpE|nr:nucleotide exchange factor GrpE [Peptococcaceae bacterium]MDH7524506.1 nucleotide exchange factor GrpE [Peptococcaceae bacterium]